MRRLPGSCFIAACGLATSIASLSCASRATEPRPAPTTKKPPEVSIAPPVSAPSAASPAEVVTPEQATPSDCSDVPRTWVHGHCRKYVEQPHVSFWRPAIENYVPAATCTPHIVADDAWLHAVRLNLEREFSAFLARLDKLDASHPMNDSTLGVKLEVVVDAREGCLLAAGVLKPSGLTAFDIGALESVRRTSPFEAYPAASTVDAIYVHWEFHRDPNHACSGECGQGFIAPKPEETGLR